MRSKSFNEEQWRETLLGKGGFLTRTHRIFLSKPETRRAARTSRAARHLERAGGECGLLIDG